MIHILHVVNGLYSCTKNATIEDDQNPIHTMQSTIKKCTHNDCPTPEKSNKQSIIHLLSLPCSCNTNKSAHNVSSHSKIMSMHSDRKKKCSANPIQEVCSHVDGCTYESPNGIFVYSTLPINGSVRCCVHGNTEHSLP